MKHFLFLGLLILVSCQKSTTEKSLIDESSVWMYRSKNILFPGKEHRMLLKFENNGWANEVNTILQHEWKYSESKNLFMIKDQKFDILEIRKDTIFMKNSNSGIPAELIKIK